MSLPGASMREALMLCLQREQDEVPLQNACTPTHAAQGANRRTEGSMLRCKTAVSLASEEKRRILETCTAGFSFHYQSTRSPKEEEETKGRVLITGVSRKKGQVFLIMGMSAESRSPLHGRTNKDSSSAVSAPLFTHSKTTNT